MHMRTTILHPLPQRFLGMLALAVALVWIGKIVSSTLTETRTRESLTITASARKPIGSNLVQWSLRVDAAAPTPVAAARRLATESATTVSFLHDQGIPAGAISPHVVRTSSEVEHTGKYTTRTTFHVMQAFDVMTDRIAVVERTATRLGLLLERGIDVSAEPLAYISTNLGNSKLDALAAATAEARHRAEILVKGLGGKLGPMRSSSQGVYQITPRDSTSVSDYGINDTSSRLKDVTAVVSATFAVRH